MRRLFFLCLVPMMFVSCANTTQDASRDYSEAIRLQEQRIEAASHSVESSDLALAQIPNPPAEVKVARSFNDLARSWLNRPLTEQEKAIVLQEVLAGIKDFEFLKRGQEEQKKIARETNEKIDELTVSLEKNLPIVFNQSQEWENEHGAWAKIKRVFKWISGLGVLGIFIYALFALGLAPIILPILGKSVGWLALKFPVMFYRFGVVAKEVVDDVASGVSNLRKEIKESKDDEFADLEERKKAKEQLKKVDSTLRTSIRPNSKTDQLIEHVRKSKNLT